MNTTTSWDFSKVLMHDIRAKDLFRERFQNALRACVRRGFSVEESFGMIWVETWEEISLNDQEQAELFGELLEWARGSLSASGVTFQNSAPAHAHASF